MLGAVATLPAVAAVGFYITRWSQPSYNSNNAGNSALHWAIPDPPTGYSDFYNALQVDQGGPFPWSQQYHGLDTGPVRQAIVGATTVPATDTTTQQAAGVAGYAHGKIVNSKTNFALVGIFGQATTSVPNANLFGGNTYATNADGTAVHPGFDVNYISGLEVDVNLWKKDNGADPVVAGGHAYGITIAGSSDLAATPNGSASVVVNYLSVRGTVPWTNGFQTYDGATINGINLGKAAAGKEQGSQIIALQAMNAGGVASTGQIFADPDGSIQLKPATSIVDDRGIPLFIAKTDLGGAGVSFPQLNAKGLLFNNEKGVVSSKSAAASRAAPGLNIEALTPHGDSDYGVLNTDRVVALNKRLTATRTWTLPPLNSMNPGQQIIFTDVVGGIGENTVILARSKDDATFAGGSTTYSWNTKLGTLVVIADTVDKIWAVYKTGP